MSKQQRIATMQFPAKLAQGRLPVRQAKALLSVALWLGCLAMPGLAMSSLAMPARAWADCQPWQRDCNGTAMNGGTVDGYGNTWTQNPGGGYVDQNGRTWTESVNGGWQRSDGYSVHENMGGGYTDSRGENFSQGMGGGWVGDRGSNCAQQVSGVWRCQ